MDLRIVGVYREPEFSPGKVEADAAIMNAVLAELRSMGAGVHAMEASQFASGPPLQAHLVVAMCQGEQALSRLAAQEKGGAITINSALAIRNCYRDLLGAGLARAEVPSPEGVLVETAAPLDLKPLRVLDVAAPMYVKRGDLHALGALDVQRVEGVCQLEATLLEFARRGIRLAYVQEEVAGTLLKFYGVSGGEFFAALGDEVEEQTQRAIAQVAGSAAAVFGLEVWGGDAIVRDGRFWIIDFNDWPSFSNVRAAAARAIARRALALLRRNSAVRGLNL